MNVSLLKRPSALLPIAMSVAALAVVLGYIAISGVVHSRAARRGVARRMCSGLLV
jgi:hypothetical protein